MSESRESRQRVLAAVCFAMPTALGAPTSRMLAFASEDALTDIARSLGLVSVCHDCGTVFAVEAGTPEPARRSSALYFEAIGMLDCCGDNTIF